MTASLEKRRCELVRDSFLSRAVNNHFQNNVVATMKVAANIRYFSEVQFISEGYAFTPIADSLYKL